MNIIKTSIDGVVIIEPRTFEDLRGYFFESFSQRGIDDKVRDKAILSDKNTKHPIRKDFNKHLNY